MEFARCEAITDFARETSLGEPFAHLINESPAR
jgi:hypothetical protein